MTQGLLGRHPDTMGSCGPCWLVNFRYLGGGGRCQGPVQGEAVGTRALEEGSALWAPQPTHASRQTEDFTRALVRAFLQRSI